MWHYTLRYSIRAKIMNLLISAYACAPNKGSEHGSAWNWISEAARLGYRLWVLVSPAHRNVIEAACRDSPLKEITWIFPEVRRWPLEQGKEPKWERTYNLLWQIEALRLARQLKPKVNFDIVHHLTWGGVRAPTFLGALDVPLIIGPVGGGETSPQRLRDKMPIRGRITETIRDISNATITLNPIVRRGLNDASVIFARTQDTKNLLTPAMQRRTRIMMELGVTKTQIVTSSSKREGPPKLLFAGRLLYWKGVHIAIEALSHLVRKMPDARLTIVGYGPEEERLKADVAARKLDANVDFVAWMPQAEFSRLYTTHDLFLFPSLHDSTGWVVLESLCQGLPVMCLDLGGPKDIVTASSGIVINTKGLNTAEVATSIAERLYDVLRSPTMLSDLSAGAISRANDFLISDRVRKLYDDALASIRGNHPERSVENLPLAPVPPTDAALRHVA